MILQWHFGFHRPYLRGLNGRIDARGWLGHCEAWGYTEDDTWLFIDPQGVGTKVRVMHRHDEVMAQLEARFALCDQILRMPAADPTFVFPLHGPMTCAAICGHLVGIRALVPAALRRKLLANGAEVIHGQAEGRSRRQGGA